jgi:hypothetical protein
MDNTNKPIERLMSENAAAAFLGVGRHLFRQLKIPYIQLAGRRMFQHEDVQAFKQQQTVTYEN